MVYVWYKVMITSPGMMSWLHHNVYFPSFTFNNNCKLNPNNQLAKVCLVM